jgi:mono/diheme cytochrome c family protein
MQQKIFIGLVLTLVIVIFIPLYWATEPGRQEAARARQQAEAVARGAELYALNCATCHGLTGEGIDAPALKGNQLDADIMKKIISRGISGTEMPAWSVEEGGLLQSHQIEDLIMFIRNWDQSLIEASSVPTPPSVPAPTPSPPPPPTASAINADELYAVNCAACHGVNRQGVSGLGPTLTPESLGALSDAAIRNTILNGRPDTPMMPFKDTFSPEEIDALLQLIKYASP